jgi:hypothetical protein
VDNFPTRAGKRSETQIKYSRIAAEAAGGTVYFLDEGGVRSDYHPIVYPALVTSTLSVRQFLSRRAFKHWH